MNAGITPIPPGFIARKTKILSDLAVPDADYTDLSPKGSVDEGIRDLIRDINALDGLVTTSSCAGRVSVFVEGSRKSNRKRKTVEISGTQETAISLSIGTSSATESAATQDQGQLAVNDNGDDEQDVDGRKFAAAGGKGEGRWLYVSHDPVNLDNTGTSFHQLFGLVPGDGIPRPSPSDDGSIRLIRFHYDPMILHVMTATLHHAHPVLAAASNAGFRESGLQSLRCLETQYSNSTDQHSSATDSTSHSPIVAVRSAGLALESVIGYCEYSNGSTDPVMRSLVKEEYLQMLVALANERFEVNTERVERFRAKLLSLYTIGSAPAPKTTHGKKSSEWEDPQARRERKRLEGLKRQADMTRQRESATKPDDKEIDMSIDF